LVLKEDEVVNGYYSIDNWHLYHKKYKNITCVPCDNMSVGESAKFYAGVPNILRLSTLRKVIDPWITYTYMFHNENNWQDEQFGYIYGLANLSMKSRAVKSLFFSGNEISDFPFTFLHYCQTYRLWGDWNFSKHEIHRIKKCRDVQTTKGTCF